VEREIVRLIYSYSRRRAAEEDKGAKADVEADFPIIIGPTIIFKVRRRRAQRRSEVAEPQTF